jgi:capsular exopolysaccharide synthesis family protein
MNAFFGREVETSASPAALASLLGGELDLRRIGAAIRRRLRPALAVAACVMIATIVLTLQATPQYVATAKVMLDPRKETVTNIQDVLSGLPPESDIVDTEVEVMKSSRLASRVVETLHLDQDPEFNGALRKPTGLRAIMHDVRAWYADRRASGKPTALEAQKQHEAIVNGVMRGLTVKRVGLTYVMDLSYQSASPTKSATIVNKFAELYLLEQLEAKFDATRQATYWLNSRLTELRNQARGDDAAVQQYKISNNLMSASGTNLTEQEISAYNQSLAQAEAQVAEDVARLNTARTQLAKGSTGDDVGAALDSPVIQRLRQQHAETSAKVADLQSRYGDRHPDMFKATRQLEDIDAQIQAEIHRIISNLQAKAEVSRQRASAIRASIGGAKGLLADNNRATVRLNELQRAADASRALYENYLNRFKETSNQQGIGQSDARILAPADIPLAASSPRVRMNLAFGLLLAFVAGAATVAVAEILEAGLATADDVERSLGASCLATLPLLASVAGKSRLDPWDYVVQKPLSSFAESFRHLRTSIQYCRGAERVQIVALTSAFPDEGKTTTAICLGRAAALQGAKVLVIDCDLRNRNIHHLFETETTLGLLQVLNGEATLEVAVAVDKASGAHFLPLAKGPRTPKDVFSSLAMDQLLASVRNQYDFVILDTAPLLPVADTRVLAPKADALILLAHWRRTPIHAIRSALKQLGGINAHMGGVVLTRVDMKQQAKHGYGDVGYYHKQYQSYYVE